MTYRNLEIAQLAKHANEALILAVVSRGDRHGYQIAVEVEEMSGGMFSFNHGTLYPILHKLEQDGLVRGRWKKEPNKRKRKYYELTGEGAKALGERTEAFRRFFDCFFTIIEGRK